MKRMFGSLLVTLAMAAAPMFAAGSGELRVNVPFDFVVSGKTMPAGEYQVTDRIGAEIVAVRALDGKVTALSVSSPGYAGPKADAALGFMNSDGKYYLVSVKRAGFARELPRPHVSGPAVLSYIKAAAR